MSVRVEIVTRALKVDAFMPCSACSTYARVKRLGLLCGRIFRIQQIKKMGGFAKILANGWQIQSISSPVKISDDDSHLGRDADGAASRRVQALIHDERRVVQA